MTSGLLIISAAIILFFQNCTPIPLSETDAQSFIEGLPFAYKTKIDHVSHLSCHGMSSQQKENFYSFYVAAEQPTSGIQLRSEYLEKTKFFTDEERALKLSESLANKNAFLMASIKRTSDLETIVQSGSTVHFAELIGKNSNFYRLDEAPISTTLSSGDGPYQSITGFNATKPTEKIEGELSYLSTIDTVKEVRAGLQAGTFILAITYGDTSDSINKFDPRRPDDSDLEHGYGTGFYLTFANSPGGKRKMNAVYEVDLETGLSTGSQWQCNNYAVFRQGEKADCPGGQNANFIGTRAYLAAGYTWTLGWRINMPLGCIVEPPGGDSCYGSLAPATALNDNNNCPDNDLKCQHFLSICYKL